MLKTVGLGDLVVSLSPNGYLKFVQANSFDIFYTGAEANVCASLSQLGLETELVTRLPDNDIGKCAVAALRKYGVGTNHIVFGGDRIGVLYMEKGASQRPSKVIYDRRNTAICEAEPKHFDFDRIFKNARWFHFTGITPALSDTAPELCLTACRIAKERNITISCDLNYRKNLWTGDKAKAVMERLLPYVDVLIANEEDVERVLGIRAGASDVTQGKLDRTGYVEVAEKLTATYNLSAVATTLRKSRSASDNGWSAILFADGKPYYSKEYDIHIVNRVGGGDSFSAGLIYSMQQGFDNQKTIEFAAAASCLKHSIEYDFNLVTVDEVLSLLKGDGSGRVQR